MTAVAATSLTALLLVPVAPATDAVAAPISAAEQLVGGWSLVSRVTTTSDGKVLLNPGLSATPKGVLIYDRYGHVAVQLYRPGRTVQMLGNECREAETIKGIDDTAQTVLGCGASFGTYTVNPREGVVTHPLESALFPGDIGKDIKSKFSISNDTLTINIHTTLRDGTPVVRTMVWTRMK